jgi:hypothetical protein
MPYSTTMRQQIWTAIVSVEIFSGLLCCSGAFAQGPPINNSFGACTTPPVWDENISGSERFVSALGGAAYCDRETGLVWEAAPGDTNGDQIVDSDDRVDWNKARYHCANTVVGGKKAWRLPSFVELATLIDPTNGLPSLPDNHPFSNIQMSFYWSATTAADLNLPSAVIASFQDGRVEFKGLKDRLNLAWCVRGPMNADVY